MNALLLGLSLAGSVAAQGSVQYMSVDYNPNTVVYSSAASSDGYAPPDASYTPPPDASYSAAASVVTPPPSYSSSSDFYQMMPYSSFESGGYQSLACGYGYQKMQDGSCQQMSWVCIQIWSHREL